MNKQELQAICLIVNKLGWNDMPVEKVINNIIEIVRYQQNAELKLFGDCDDFEESLLSMATWNHETLMNIHVDVVMTEVYNMCEFLGCDGPTFIDTVAFYNSVWDEQMVEEEDMAYEAIMEAERYWWLHHQIG